MHCGVKCNYNRIRTIQAVRRKSNREISTAVDSWWTDIKYAVLVELPISIRLPLRTSIRPFFKRASVEFRWSRSLVMVDARLPLGNTDLGVTRYTTQNENGMVMGSVSLWPSCHLQCPYGLEQLCPQHVIYYTRGKNEKNNHGGDGMLTYVTHVNQQVWTTRNWFRPDDTQISSSGNRY